MSRSPNPPSTSSPFAPVLALGVVVLLMLLAATGLKGYGDLRAARQREQLLDAKIVDAERRVTELRERLERLRSDPATLERLAREELGMVRPEDIVIVLPEEAPP